MSTRDRILATIDRRGEVSGADIWRTLRWYDLRMYAHLYDMESENVITSRWDDKPRFAKGSRHRLYRRVK